MSLSPEEQAELLALQKRYGGAPTPTAVPTRTAGEEQELRALQMKLHGGPKPTDEQAMRYGMNYDTPGVPRETPRFKDRLQATGEFAAEMSGIPGAGRLMGFNQPEGYKERPIEYDEQGRPDYSSLLTPQEWDAVNTALLGGGAFVAKAVGKLAPFFRGLGLSTATGATAAGMTYPETQAIASKVEDPGMRSAVQMAPGLAGAMFGPGALAVGGRAMGSAIGRQPGLSLQEVRQHFNPATEAAVMRASRAGEYLDPRAATAVRQLEGEGVPVSPAQAQALGEKMTGTRPASNKLADFERRTATTDAARRFQAAQGAGAKALVTREASKSTPGAAMSAEEAGSGLIQGVEKRIAGVGSALDDAESQLHGNKFMSRPDKAYAKAMGEAFQTLMSDQKLFGRSAAGSAVTKQTLKTLTALYNDSKKLKSGSDAIRFTHRAVQELDEAFQGGGGLDAGTKGKLYGLLREATVKGIARNKSLAPLAKAWDKAMSDYATVIHEQGGKSAQQLAGVTPKGVRAGDISTKTSAGVSKSLAEGHVAAKVVAAVRSGSMSANDARAALLTGLRDGAMQDDVFRADVFARNWKKLPAEAKALVGPEVSKALDALADKYTVLGDGVEARTMEKGYGAGSAMRASGGSLAASAPLLGEVANRMRNFKPGYYSWRKSAYMPQETPRPTGTTAKVAIDTPAYASQALRNKQAQDEKLKAARERAKRFIKGRK